MNISDFQRKIAMLKRLATQKTEQKNSHENLVLTIDDVAESDSNFLPLEQHGHRANDASDHAPLHHEEPTPLPQRPSMKINHDLSDEVSHSHISNDSNYAPSEIVNISSVNSEYEEPYHEHSNQRETGLSEQSSTNATVQEKLQKLSRAEMLKQRSNNLPPRVDQPRTHPKLASNFTKNDPLSQATPHPQGNSALPTEPSSTSPGPIPTTAFTGLEKLEILDRVQSLNLQIHALDIKNNIGKYEQLLLCIVSISPNDPKALNQLISLYTELGDPLLAAHFARRRDCLTPL